MTALIDTGRNPISVIREERGLSIREAAKRIGCHFTGLAQCESAMYPSLLPVVLDWAVKTGDYSPYDISEAYNRFQRTRRTDSVIEHEVGLLTIDSLGEPGDHPLKALRLSMGMNQYQFCKAFCIPSAWMYQAEGAAQVLPFRLKRLLSDLGFPLPVLREMDCRYELVR